MALQKPFNLRPNGTYIDITEDNVLSWSVTGAIQYAFEISIKNNATDVEVLAIPKTTSFSTSYTLTASVAAPLSNGEIYKWTVKVYDSTDNSQTSLPVIFQTSSRPVVTITDPTTTVASQTYTLQAGYVQAESVPLASWIGYLYNSSQVLISNTGIQTAATPTYYVEGLQSGSSYYTRFTITSNDGLVGDSGLVAFDVSYAQPVVQTTLVAENTDDCGVQLTWDVVQIIGEGEDYSFVADEEVDVTAGRVWFDTGFNIDNNFTCKIWLRQVTNYDFNVVTDAEIIACASTPVNTDALWLVDPDQATEQILTLVASPTFPTVSNALWIQDLALPIERQLTLNIDIVEPDNITIAWLDLNADSEDLTLVKLNGTGGNISLRYFNDSFHLYLDDTLIDSLALSGTEYYVYIQQIGDTLSLGGSVVTP